MNTSCVICSDLFDEVNTIVCISCGHVFHETCIIRWFDCSDTCPECRKRVTRKSLTKLYFNIVPNSELPKGCVVNQISELEVKIREKDIEICNIRKAKEEIREYVRIAEQKASDLEQDVYKLKTEVSNLKLINRDLKKKASKTDELEAMNRSLVDKVEMLQNVQTVLTGTQKDVDDILETMANEANATRSIATYCSLLKRELKHASESKQNLRNEIANLRRNSAVQTVKIKDLNARIEVLKEQVLSLEKENVSLLTRLETNRKETECKSDAVVSYESPAPVRLDSTSRDEAVTPEALQGTHVIPDFKRRRIAPVAHYEHTISLPMKSTKKLHLDSTDIHSVLKHRNTLEKSNENSSIRSGYNGLGGHSKFIARSSTANKNFKPPSKR